MRRLFKVMARGVFVVSVMVALSVPAEAARKQDRAPREAKERVSVVKAIKGFAVRVLGDMIIIPKP